MINGIVAPFMKALSIFFKGIYKNYAVGMGMDVVC